MVVIIKDITLKKIIKHIILLLNGWVCSYSDGLYIKKAWLRERGVLCNREWSSEYWYLGDSLNSAYDVYKHEKKTYVK